MIKCDASWTSDVYDNFQQYVKGVMTMQTFLRYIASLLGKTKSSTTGFGIHVLPDTDIRSFLD